MHANIHDRARLLAAQRGISLEAARAELGRRGAAARRARYGRKVITEADRRAFEHVEPPRQYRDDTLES